MSLSYRGTFGISLQDRIRPAAHGLYGITRKIEGLPRLPNPPKARDRHDQHSHIGNTSRSEALRVILCIHSEATRLPHAEPRQTDVVVQIMIW